MSVDQFWRLIRPGNKLFGKRSFVFLPVFTYNVNWSGASEIITQFNYTAERNFVLPRGVVKPEDANFVAAIKWVDEDENVFRYLLWQDSDLVLNAPLIKANNKIGSEFTIEIWNLNNEPVVSLDEPLKIYTSLIKEITDVTAVTDVEEDETALEVPYNQLLNTNTLSQIYTTLAELEALMPGGGDIVAWYKLEIGDPTTFLINGASYEWYDQSGHGRTLVQATPANYPAFNSSGFGFKDRPFLRFTSMSQMQSAALGITNNVIEMIYIVMRVNAHDSAAVLFDDTGRNLINFLSTEGKIDYTIPTAVPVTNEVFYDGLNKPFLLVAGRGNRTISNDFSQILETGPYTQPFEQSILDATRGGEVPATIFKLGDVNPSMVQWDVAEIIMATLPYDTNNDPTDFDQAVRRYLANKFEGLMEIPFTFSRDAASQITPTT